VHRAGRTARANRKGEALIIVDRTEGNKWGEINDILNSSVPNRKVDKFVPAKVIMDEIENQVTQLEWIRVNN
jgi:superfamily II DNA/RNA helicase